MAWWREFDAGLGYRISRRSSTLNHAFYIDVPGKDSYRHREAVSTK